MSTKDNDWWEKDLFYQKTIMFKINQRNIVNKLNRDIFKIIQQIWYK